jgi:hypothetical protein
MIKDHLANAEFQPTIFKAGGDDTPVLHIP